jgi:hypothetical protein
LGVAWQRSVGSAGANAKQVVGMKSAVNDVWFFLQFGTVSCFEDEFV